MYNDLVEIIININEYGIYNTIIVDNNKKEIVINEKIIKLNIQKYNDFLNNFFRIIRDWKTEFEEAENTIINIRIIEKDNQYDYHIHRKLPNNYDSFQDLIHTLY